MRKEKLGARIKSIERIITLAKQGKAIKHTQWLRPTSAAFLQNWPARNLYNAIKDGYLFEVKKK